MNAVAQRAMDAVEKWADGWYLIRETGIAIAGSGRVDGLLVPVHRKADCMRSLRCPYWERPRLIGVELKLDRGDFLRGCKSGQYERYAETLSGLFVVTPRGLCRTSELPSGVGHLVLADNLRKKRCVCKRYPDYRDRPVDAETAWRITHQMFEEFQTQRRLMEKKHREKLRWIGRIAGERVFRALARLDESISVD